MTSANYTMKPSEFHQYLAKPEAVGYVEGLWERLEEINFQMIMIDKELWSGRDVPFNSDQILQMAVLLIGGQNLTLPKRWAGSRFLRVYLSEETMEPNIAEIANYKMAYEEVIRKAHEDGRKETFVSFDTYEAPFAIHVLGTAELILLDGLDADMTEEGISFNWKKLNPPVSTAILTDFLKAYPLPSPEETSGV